MPRVYWRSAFTWVALVLVACSAKREALPSQVVATVNQREISVHQLGFALQQRPEPSIDPGDAQKALEGLIDEELAVQAALDAKLDRDPNVLLALEAGRREILARAFLDRATAATGKPTPEEVARDYAEKPALFGQRRVYLFQEIDIDVPPEALPALEAQLAARHSAAGVARAVAEAGLRHTVQQATRTPEALPMDVLDKVAPLAEGQTAVLPAGRHRVKAMTLLSAMAAPVDEEQARPIIAQYLLNRQRSANAEAQVHSLREKADIRLAPSVAPAAPASSPKP